MKWTKEARMFGQKSIKPEILEFALESIDDGLFVDIGACVGSFSIPIMERRPEARCLMFEPVTRTYNVLLEMLALNGVSADVYRLAISSTTGNTNISVPKDKSKSGLSTIGVPKRFKDYYTETVQSARLDDFELSDLQFVKIDAEGAELSVLLGARKTLQSTPNMCIECTQRNAVQFGHTVDDVLELLTGIGYDCWMGTRRDIFCTASH